MVSCAFQLNNLSIFFLGKIGNIFLFSKWKVSINKILMSPLWWTCRINYYSTWKARSESLMVDL